MTTMMPELDNNPKLCAQSEVIGHTLIDLKEVTTMATKASHQLADAHDNASVEELALSAREIWQYVERFDRPDGPSNHEVDTEREAGWAGNGYMPDAPDEVERAQTAARSAARGLAVMLRLMAAQFDTVDKI